MDYAFVVTQIGKKGSVERKRANEITDYVIKPVLDENRLALVRADRDPTPGQITPQLLRQILEARVVIADLTDKNPNVYYELGVAHSFSRVVIPLIDVAGNMAFDTKDEKVIEVGRYDTALTVPQAEEAKEALREALRVVLSDSYKPSSLVAEVATSRSIDQLAPENPVAAELAAIRVTLDELRSYLGRPQEIDAPVAADVREMRRMLEALVRITRAATAVGAVEGIERESMSAGFDPSTGAPQGNEVSGTYWATERAIRQWAREQGLQVSDDRHIPEDVAAKYFAYRQAVET